MAVTLAYVKDTLRGAGQIRPRVVGRKKEAFAKVVELMATGTGLDPKVIESVFGKFVDALIFFLSRGDQVDSPLGVFRLGVRQGVHRESAKTRLTLNPHAELANRLSAASPIEVVEAPQELVPCVDTLANVNDPEKVAKASTGELLQIGGRRLSFAKDDAEQGLFFVATDDSAVRMTVYSRAGSSRIDGLTPALPPGDYRVEVRTRLCGVVLKAGALKQLLTIA